MAISLERLKDEIEKAVPGASVTINDLVGDGDHLQAIVVSDAFNGKSLLEQHRMIFDPLKETLKADLHALTLKTYTPEQWNKNRRN